MFNNAKSSAILAGITGEGPAVNNQQLSKYVIDVIIKLSESTLDTKKLVDTFVDQMSSSFTAWVNGQTGATDSSNTTTQPETQPDDKKEDKDK